MSNDSTNSKKLISGGDSTLHGVCFYSKEVHAAEAEKAKRISLQPIGFQPIEFKNAAYFCANKTLCNGF
ncbi:MAG: hypothetical protein GC192_17535 [Bacteroidetes bacterium]|nr:hypothetical protein [Bacteroidota bacterium]